MSSSAILQHCKDSNHPLPTVSNFNIIDKETNDTKRKILEGMYIKVNNPPLNRNVGKFEVPNVYNTVLNEKGGLLLSCNSKSRDN